VSKGFFIPLLPFIKAGPGELAALRDSVSRSAATPRRSPGTGETWPTAHDEIRREIATYLLARLALRAGDTISARLGVAKLASWARSAGPRAVVHDLAASVRAQLAMDAGRPADALRELEAIQVIDARVDQVGASPFYSQGLDRFAYASLLEAAGRLEEAAVWYGSFAASSIFDLVFLAPSHLRRGMIAERLGRAAEARRHYQAAVALWGDCDPPLRWVTEQARARLAALPAAP
jgi:hypothetical protein